MVLTAALLITGEEQKQRQRLRGKLRGELNVLKARVVSLTEDVAKNSTEENRKVLSAETARLTNLEKYIEKQFPDMNSSDSEADIAEYDFANAVMQALFCTKGMENTTFRTEKHGFALDVKCGKEIQRVQELIGLGI